MLFDVTFPLQDLFFLLKMQINMQQKAPSSVQELQSKRLSKKKALDAYAKQQFVQPFERIPMILIKYFTPCLAGKWLAHKLFTYKLF